MKSFLYEFAEGAFRLFFWLTLSGAIFAWVASEVLFKDPAVRGFAEFAEFALLAAGVAGMFLIVADWRGWPGDGTHGPNV